MLQLIIINVLLPSIIDAFEIVSFYPNGILTVMDAFLTSWQLNIDYFRFIWHLHSLITGVQFIELQYNLLKGGNSCMREKFYLLIISRELQFSM